MSEESYKNFVKILKETGATVDPAYFRWMFDDTSAPGHKLINWIANNVTSDNYLTPTERREYDELVASGELLYQTELEAAVSRIEDKYPGIFDHLEHKKDDEYLLEQIEFYESENERLSKCLDALDDVKESTKGVNDLCDAEKECFESLSRCHDARNELQYTMKQFQKQFNQNMFLSQLDIDFLVQKIPEFRTLVNLYLEKQFPKDDQCEKEKTDLIMLYERLMNTIYMDVCYEVEAEAWKICMERLPKIHEQIKSISNIDTEIQFVKMSTRNLEREEERFLDEIKDSAKTYTLGKLMQAQYESNKCTLARRKASLEKLERLEVIFKDFLSMYELLWHLLSTEGRFIKEAQTTFKDVQLKSKSAQRDVKLRLLELKNFCTKDSTNNNLCEWLVRLMQNHDITFKKLESSADLVSLFTKLEKDFETAIYMHEDHLKNLTQDVKTYDNFILNKNTIIYSNISRSPITTSPCHYTLFKSRNVLQQLEAMIMTEKNTFTRKKQALERNKVLEALHDLWIDFLCEPHKVHVLIQNVKATIQNSTRMVVRNRRR